MYFYEKQKMGEKKKLIDSDSYFKFKEIIDDFKVGYGFASQEHLEIDDKSAYDKIFEDSIKVFDQLRKKISNSEKDLDHELDYHSNRIFRKIIEIDEIEGKNELSYLKSNSPDIVEQIKKEYQQNKKEIILDDIMPLMDNFEFIDLIVEKRIPFKSLINKRFSEVLSKTLLYLSNKKSLGKGGNPYVGKTVAKLADNFAEKMSQTIEELDELGFNSLKEKADELNSRNIKTHRGKDWTKTAVSRVIKRLQKDKSLNNNDSSKKLKPE